MSRPYIYQNLELLRSRDHTFLCLTPVLVSQGCCNVYHTLGVLQQQKFIICTVLEARTSRNQCISRAMIPLKPMEGESFFDCSRLQVVATSNPCIPLLAAVSLQPPLPSPPGMLLVCPCLHVAIFSFYTSVILDKGPPLMTSSKFDYICKVLIAK